MAVPPCVYDAGARAAEAICGFLAMDAFVARVMFSAVVGSFSQCGVESHRATKLLFLARSPPPARRLRCALRRGCVDPRGHAAGWVVRPRCGLRMGVPSTLETMAPSVVSRTRTWSRVGLLVEGDDSQRRPRGIALQPARRTASLCSREAFGELSMAIDEGGPCIRGSKAEITASQIQLGVGGIAVWRTSQGGWRAS